MATSCETTLSESDFELFVNQISNEVSPIDDIPLYHECPNCLVSAELVGDEYICPECFQICGIRDDGIDYATIDGYTTSNVPTNPMRIMGKGPETWNMQKALQRMTVSSRNDTVKQSTEKYIQQCAYRKKIDLPQKIIESALNDYYIPLLEACGSTFRNPVRQGVLTACIYYAYRSHGTPKPTSELRMIFDVEEQHVSSGIRKLQQSIKTPDFAIELDPTIGYIDQIVSTHNIDEKYLPFMNDLANALIPRNMNGQQFRPGTKSAGVVHILSQCLKLGIDIDQIADKKIVATNSILRITSAVVACLHNENISNVFRTHSISPAMLNTSKTKRKTRTKKKTTK